jgi:hypothetical protein
MCVAVTKLTRLTDEDVVRFLSTRRTQLNVYAKTGGMSLVNKTKDNTGSFFANPYVIAMGFIYATALLALAFRMLLQLLVKTR